MFTLAEAKKEGKVILTIPEVAGILRISVQSTYKAIKDGTIPTVPLIRYHRISVKMLEEFLANPAKNNGKGGAEAKNHPG